MLLERFAEEVVAVEEEASRWRSSDSSSPSESVNSNAHAPRLLAATAGPGPRRTTSRLIHFFDPAVWIVWDMGRGLAKPPGAVGRGTEGPAPAPPFPFGLPCGAVAKLQTLFGRRPAADEPGCSEFGTDEEGGRLEEGQVEKQFHYIFSEQKYLHAITQAYICVIYYDAPNSNQNRLVY